MDDSKEATETLIKRETVTEFDAVHPRFIQQDSEEIRKYEIEHYYFCKQCDLFFAPTVIGLKTHFKADRVNHTPCGSCFYCKGKVYEYSLNNEPRVYHNCRDTEDP